MDRLHTVMVPIGEFRVSTDPVEVLTTCVGSCVAVALADPAAGVAGLLHAVLPGPPSEKSAGYPSGYYADPGLRLLLGEALRRGATRENLTAVVAGGGSLLGQSVGLTVGERNQHQIHSLLEEEGISVRARELGGRVGRFVSLAVGTGDVEVRGTSLAPPHQPGDTSALGDPAPQRLSEVADWLSCLAPNPRAAGGLLDALHRPEIDWAAVSTVASRDMVLMFQLLRLANSEAYGRPREIGSVESALALLGPAQVRRICVLVATARNATHSLVDLGPLAPVLSRHCLASALAARRLSAAMPARARQEVFAASLLHGLDALVAAVLAKRGEPLCDGGPPSEAGARVLAGWKFPEGIVEAVRGETAQQACAIVHWLGVPCESNPSGHLTAAPSDATILGIAEDLYAAGLLDAPLLRVSEGRSL